MKYLSFLLLLGSFNVYSQIPIQINKAIGLPDSLTFENEIRVYKFYYTTNGTEIFRSYEVENNKWKTEYYVYFAAIDSENVKEHFEKEELTIKRDLNFVWVDVLNVHILDIPDQDEIQYKLEDPIEAFIEDGRYYYRKISRPILDGIGYIIHIKSKERQIFCVIVTQRDC